MSTEGQFDEQIVWELYFDMRINVFGELPLFVWATLEMMYCVEGQHLTYQTLHGNSSAFAK